MGMADSFVQSRTPLRGAHPTTVRKGGRFDLGFESVPERAVSRIGNSLVNKNEVESDVRHPQGRPVGSPSSPKAAERRAGTSPPREHTGGGSVRRGVGVSGWAAALTPFQAPV